MLNNTKIPPIEFGEDCDYDSLYIALHSMNEISRQHMRRSDKGEGITYDFHMLDGTTHRGTLLDELNVDNDDYVILALHSDGDDNGVRVTVKTDDIIRIIYL